ncbi:MAG: hypothetical protein H0W78_01035 [Planctomycetes bacterium]|nr:hypothetical protein [Planctomycetota bacterium]
MSRRSRFWWRSILTIALAVVAVVSVWSWWVQPETTQLGFARIPGGARSSVILTNQDAAAPRNQASVAWRMHLRIDAALKPPGPAWLMFEGGRAGDGYELQWQPSRLSLTLTRGNPALVLGVTSLDHFPQQVVLVRHGFRVEVWADEVRVLNVFDPQTTPAASAWGFQAAGPMEGSTVSLHDDRHVLPVSTVEALSGNAVTLQRLLSDPQQPDHALFITRQALVLDAEKNPTEKSAAVRAAAVAIGAFNAKDPILAELRQWLAWGDAQVALVRQDLDAAKRTSDAVQELIRLAGAHPVSESAGLAMELLDRLVRTGSRPPYRAPEDVVRWRDQWFATLAACATAALAHSSSAIPEEWRWQLRLIIHGAECLRGGTRQPTPAEAPEWVASRWRAFAGGNPGGASFSSPIPLLAEERNPMRPALERLIQLAAFEPGGLAAVSMRAAIVDALDTAAPPHAGPETITEQYRLNRARALEATRASTAPAREATLAQAILALNGIGDPSAALRELDPDENHRLPTGDGSVPLARRDPLAYALYRLLRHRWQGSTPGHPDSPFAPKEQVPEALVSPFGRLLSGRPEATHEAWITDPTVLPPVQALAAALAMQEVLRLDARPPNWSLLDQVPCFTLPLRLMKPASGSPDDKLPGIPTVVP